MTHHAQRRSGEFFKDPVPLRICLKSIYYNISPISLSANDV